MITIIRFALFGLGALTLPLAAGFLLAPARIALRLGLEPTGPVGLSTLRGDFFALFLLFGWLSNRLTRHWRSADPLAR